MRGPHRIAEGLSVVATAAIAASMLGDLVAVAGRGAWLLLASSVWLARPVADAISGVIHWAADVWLPEDAPYLGPRFVRPFREHHDDPAGIADHDFLETNGNTFLLVAPALGAAWWLLAPALDRPVAQFGLAFAVALAAWLAFTNQIHRWAHASAVPRAVAWLQRRGVILDPAHHALHHAPPYDRCFCITSGGCNALLDGLGVFRRLGQWERR